ncbi:MAG: hypothetical protein F6K19_23150 [Cyanothece sp. SIO1E1]|nr:hypothetical protein [Cyanothece sp. SIO1E1]
MIQPEDILEGARSIRPYLPELVGNEYLKLDQKVASLLNQANQGQPVHDLLLDLLKSYQATYNWMAEFLGPQQNSKGFEQLPGSSGLTSALKYTCPYNDYTWFRRTIGSPIPTCPTHQIQLVLANNE